MLISSIKWDWSAFWAGLKVAIFAILLLVAAFIVAAIAKALVVKLLTSTRANNIISKADGDKPGSTANFVGKLVYLIVFLLFVPGIFHILGVSSVGTPISEMLNKVWGYIPNILAAIIVLVVGFMIAKLVRQLLIPVFQKIRVDKLQEKAGVEVADSAKLSSTLAYIVYVLILIPVIIVALQVLRIEAVSAPAISMLQKVFDFIPNIVVACLIIFVGVLIGRFAGQIVARLIAATGVDAKVRGTVGEKMGNVSLSSIIGRIIQVVIVIFFVVQGLSVIKLATLSNIGTAIIAYMPKVLAAALILIGAFFLASFVQKSLKKIGYDFYGFIAKGAILVFASFMILNQLGIANDIVRMAFFLIMAALAVAFAIAFGVGGREFAASVLKDWKTKNDEIKREAPAKAAAAKAEAAAQKSDEPSKMEMQFDDDADGAVGESLDNATDAAEGAADNLANKLVGKITGDKD